MQFKNITANEDLELSTRLIIHEAENRGFSVEILDKANNFIRISNNDRSEYIMQATRTRSDSYISPLIMENKLVTKIILGEAGINTPSGSSYLSIQSLIEDFPKWKNRAFVIKPNSTNFGKSVFLFPSGAAEKDFALAAESAFKADKQVLVEQLFEGKEYRFLVIGNYVRAVLHRVPANVTGDGNKTIAELVNDKNKNPLRGKGYVTPLEKLELGDEEKMYLDAQGFDFTSVPAYGETIYLRENSNISTGGDSIDFTDNIDPSYKDIAVAAAKAVDASICGVDLIAKDITRHADTDNYTVIELNFNPALHIHDFPANGKNRKVEKHVLDLLGLQEEKC